jgi:hypothetical protein
VAIVTADNPHYAERAPWCRKFDRPCECGYTIGPPFIPAWFCMDADESDKP